MTLTSGFYDSLGGDRRYTAAQFGALFKGIFMDGVLKGVGEAFGVSPVSGNTVSIGSGRAWFNGIWVDNDTALRISLEPAESVLNRYDSIILEIDKTQSGRRAQFRIVKGSASSSTPHPPSISSSGNVFRYEIARIYRPKGVSHISTHHITNRIGTTTTPWARSLASIHDAVSPADLDLLGRSVTANDLMIVAKEDRLGKVELSSVLLEGLCRISERNRNSLFRGKYLGSSISSAQATAIRSGAFTDMYIGDYWTISGVNWRIAHFDYYYGVEGGQAASTHHVVLVPDTAYSVRRFHSTTNISGGFTGSELFTQGMTEAIRSVWAAFPNNRVSYKEWLISGVANHQISNLTQADVDVTLMSEVQVYGNISRGGRTQTNYSSMTNSKGQFALFHLAPEHIPTPNRQAYWLRDIASASHGIMVTGTGSTHILLTTQTCGLRPYLLLKG